MRLWLASVQNAIERARTKQSFITDEVRSRAVNAQEHVTKSGWVLIKNKRQWAMVKDAVFIWFEHAPRAVRSHSLCRLE
jgi:hypothetical protein